MLPEFFVDQIGFLRKTYQYKEVDITNKEDSDYEKIVQEFKKTMQG